MMNETEQSEMNKVKLISVKPTGTRIQDLELSEVTLRRGDQTLSAIMYWDNPELLGLEGTFEEILEGDVPCDFECC